MRYNYRRIQDISSSEDVALGLQAIPDPGTWDKLPFDIPTLGREDFLLFNSTRVHRGPNNDGDGWRFALILTWAGSLQSMGGNTSDHVIFHDGFFTDWSSYLNVISGEEAQKEGEEWNVFLKRLSHNKE